MEIEGRHPEIKARIWNQIHRKMATFLEAQASLFKTKVIAVELDTLKNTWARFLENYVLYKNENQQVFSPEHVELIRTYDEMIEKTK